MSVTRTFLVTVTNVNSWNDSYTTENVKAVIEGIDCSVECEGITLKVDKIEEKSE